MSNSEKVTSRIISDALVTIIIPTIGRPDYILNSVLSALNQDYTRIEVLISDNYVERPTKSLLQQAGISDSRIRILERNSRLSFHEHVNTCISEAFGKYVMLLSDDDMIATGYISEMIQAIRSDDLITVCIGEQQKIAADDFRQFTGLASTLTGTVYDGVSFANRALCDGGMPGIMTYVSLFGRKADILNAGGFAGYPSGAHSDNILFYRLALAGKVYVGRSIMYYRVYQGSFGLSMSFSDLFEGTSCYVLDLIDSFSCCARYSKLKLLVFAYSQILGSAKMMMFRFLSLYSKKSTFYEIALVVLMITSFSLKTLLFIFWRTLFRRPMPN